MSHPTKRVRYDSAAVATAQYYNTTGTVPSSFQLSADLSYLITTQPNCTIAAYELPPQSNEKDLRDLFSTYGPVKNLQIVCNGRAALIEFNEISLPTRLVHWAKINPFCVGVTPVRLEFSSQTITAPVNSGKQATSQNATSTTDSTPSTVLHLDITNAEYPITVDVLKAICSPHGQLQKIMIGKKNADKSLEAFVEFATVEEAKKAQENLDGADIYSGCCSLTVTFSKLKVHVTKNDTESWDFTDSTTSKEGLLSSTSGQRTLLGPTTNGNNSSSSSVPPPESAPTVAPVTQISAPAQISAPPTVANPPVAYPPQSYYGYSAPQPVPTQYMPAGYYCSTPMMPGQPMPGFPSPAGPYGMPMHSPYYQHPAAGYPGYPQGYMSGSQIPTQHSTARSAPQILPTPPPVHHVTPAGIGIGHSTSNLNSTSVAAARNTDMSIFHAEEGAVLMACNLPEGVNCDHLFNVLCLYGNIARIKFLKSRPGCAMIQMGSKESADRVSEHLNGATVFGQVIQFHHSKQTEVQEHAGLGTLSDGSPVMKNYMTDSNNRFRNPIVAAKSRILAPTRTLHFFNAPLNFSPEDMCRVFADCGVKRPPRIVVFTAKPGQKTSLGLAEWDTVPDALDALSLSNHRPIHIVGFAHPFHLKLAFSPKPISDDRAGACMIKYPAPPIHHKEAVISRKPSFGTAATSDITGYGFQPHTIVTVASPSLQAAHLQAASDGDKPAEIGTAVTPHTRSHDSRGSEERTVNEAPTTSEDFSVDELEAAEAAYLASITAAAANQGAEEPSKPIENEEKVEEVEQCSSAAPSLEQADPQMQPPSPTLESDSEAASLRPIRRQPTTPPSEPEDDE
ncbi:hypothetical protein SprV_0802489400 [Sparganum proliferum]